MFNSVVALYREAGRPPLSDLLFAYDGPTSSTLVDAIARCRNIGSLYGMFEDGPDFSDGHVDFTWKLASNEEGRFYDNAEAFVRESTLLSAGIHPENFYIVEEDFYSGDAQPPHAVASALLLSDLIQLLGKLALSDSITDRHRPRRLLFVRPAGDSRPPRTLELETRITPATLGGDAMDLRLLRDLVGQDNVSSLHIYEHRQIFRVAIADVLSEAPLGADLFAYLVEHWARVLEVYGLNADIYVHQFSFEKVRVELARTQLDYASRLASLLGDSSGKLLALPLSLAALVGIVKTEVYWEAALLVLGATLVSLLVSGTIHNQLLAYDRIRAGFELALGQGDGGAAKYPAALQKPLADARTAFELQGKFLLRVLRWTRPLSWAPAVVGTLIVLYRFMPN